MGNDNDYKYVIQEVSRTMIGARYSFAELMEDDRVPFKLQTIIDRMILEYADAESTIGDELKRTGREDKNYRIYENLKLKVSCYERSGAGYKDKTYRIDELAQMDAGKKEELIVHEVSVSNLALMAFKM